MAKTRRPNGQGNIYKRDDGRYEWKQMIDGEMRYASDMDLKELQKKITILSGRAVNGDKTKLFDWMERWLEKYVKPYKKPSTYSNYYFAYQKYVKKHMRNIQLRHVQRSDVQDMIAALISEGKSESLIKNVRKALSVAFISAAEDERLIDFNPTKDTKIPRGRKPARKTFDASELKTIIDKFQTSRWLYGVLFMLATGLRRGELLALKWTDIDFLEKRIKIVNNSTQYGNGTPKDNDYHYVPFTEHAKVYLAGWKNQLETEHNPAIYKNTDTIFVKKDGTPLRPSSFNNILAKRNFDFKVTPHMFRHTFVYLSKGKVSLSELQEALGHDQSTTTLDIYGLMLANTAAVSEKIEQAYKELDETIKEIKKSKIVDFTARRLSKKKLS
jgi:integrase